jgi:type IV pilus assembly protein PilB
VASDEPGRGARRLRREFGVEEIEYVVVTPTTFKRLQWMLGHNEGEGLEETSEPDDLCAHDVDLQTESVALFETLLVEAVEQRASDLHLENMIDDTRVRIRVDGDLRILSHYAIGKATMQSIVRVVKIRTGLDITDNRVAQSGQYEAHVGGCDYFVRVQTQPTFHGENVVMRLLPQSPEIESIEHLGFSAHVEARYRRLLANPGGLVLVVGPTGSGKTTSLYAGLRALANDTQRKVISIENPVEYACAGIQQVEVSPAVGFGFADAMRVFVRQDPDVILLGEVRDHETAREAIRASQTGHLVLTTLHCNDAVDAVQRLFDLEMLPNSVASELLAVFAQRLVTRICDHCRAPAPLDETVAAEIFPDGAPEGFESFRGRGCPACDGTGSHGRIAVVEFLQMNSALKRAITNGASVEALRAVAREAGLLSMRDRALELVEAGVIAFESLPRFIPIDRLVPPGRDPA